MLKKILAVLLLAGAVITAVEIIRTEKLKQELRIDLSEVNHIRYNLLNVEEWSV